MPRTIRTLGTMVSLGLLALTVAACGTDPTATPTPNPSPTPQATRTVQPGQTPTPTATRVPATPTPTAVPVTFEGKTVKIIVASAPGGGFDTAARITGKYLPNHLPGNPKFVVQNISGGAQLRGHIEAYQSRPDGLTIGMLHPRWLKGQILGQPVEGFDPSKIISLGTPTSLDDSNIFCVERSLGTSWQDIRNLGRTITAGDPGVGNPGADILELIGEPVRMVYGYGGSSEVLAAFDRGEIDSTSMYCTPGYVERLFPDWIEDQRIAPLFYNSKESPPDPEYLKKLGVASGEIPYVLDLPGLTINAEQRAAYGVHEALSKVSRLYFMPPDVPQPIVDTWLAAIHSLNEDDEYKAAMDVAGYPVHFGFIGDEFNEVFTLADQLGPAGRDVLIALAGAD